MGDYNPIDFPTALAGKCIIKFMPNDAQIDLNRKRKYLKIYILYVNFTSNNNQIFLKKPLFSYFVMI